jgi:hypothetical protein
MRDGSATETLAQTERQYDRRLPSYLCPIVRKPNKSQLLDAVDQATRPDILPNDVREYLALELSNVYPYMLDEKDLEWIQSQLAGVSSFDPLNPRESAVRAFLNKTRETMYSGPIVLATSSAKTCDICMDEKTSLVRLKCWPSHQYEANACVECVADKFVVTLNKNGEPATCPICSALVPTSDVKTILDTAGNLSGFTKTVAEYAHRNDTILGREKLIVVECPFCEGTDVKLGPVSNAYCQNPDCVASFCVDCKLRAHNPFSCESWRAVSAESVELPPDIARMTRRCPKCKRQQTKDSESCNKMICGQNVHGSTTAGMGGCGTEYCFVCEDYWENHGSMYYTCHFVPR